MGSGNENAPNDMGAFVKNIDHIRAATNAHLMVIHHSGKDVAKGARGHSSLRAATDTEIEINAFTAITKKQRDQDFGQPIGFRLQQVEIGKNKQGQSITSCVVQPANVSVIKDFSKEALDPTSLAGKAFKALANALDWCPQPAPNELDLEDGALVVSMDSWRDEFAKIAYPEGGKSKTMDTAFRRAVSQLSAKAYVQMTEVFAWLPV